MIMLWIFFASLILILLKRLRDHYKMQRGVIDRLCEHLEMWGQTTKSGDRLTAQEMKRFLVPTGDGDFRAHCVDCGAELLEGPHGGLSVNYLCPHRECGSRFNFMGPFGVERISDAQPGKPTPRPALPEGGPYR